MATVMVFCDGNERSIPPKNTLFNTSVEFKVVEHLLVKT